MFNIKRASIREFNDAKLRQKYSKLKYNELCAKVKRIV